MVGLGFLHIYVLTNISSGQYIRQCEYIKEASMDAIKTAVQEKYGEAARRARSGSSATCGCASDCCGTDPITSNFYDDAEAGAVPAEAMLASLGCGNPTALAELSAGETVLDLGSGGGIDVLLSARRVGPTGKAIRPRYDRRDAGACT